MGICLGNLKTEEILNRLGIELSTEDFETLDRLREDKANAPSGKWHGFDIPFQITCGDEETARVVVGILSPLADQFKTKIQITY